MSLVFAVFAAVLMTACASTGSGPVVHRLTQRQYSPTQTVDVLSAAPQRPFKRIARLRANDPTGSATRSQLVAELVNAAQKLGANAIVVQQVSQSSGSELSFAPSGGQMQSSGGGQPLALKALAIRYGR